MATFLTGDHHFRHERVLALDGRPFASIEEHDAALEAAWNQTVRPGDTVLYLGDFSFDRRKPEVTDRLGRLHGTKILVRGNHDHRKVRNAPGWASVHDEIETTLRLPGGADQKVFLRHDPVRGWGAGGVWHFHGHSHGKIGHDLAAGRVDVGVVCWGYRPVSLAELAVEIGRAA